MAEPKEEHCLSNVAQCCEVTAVYQMPATLVDVPLVCNGIDRICNTSTKRKRVVLRFGTTRLRFVLVYLIQGKQSINWLGLCGLSNAGH